MTTVMDMEDALVTTPCPVSWCTKAPGHPWIPDEEYGPGHGARFHRQQTGQIPTSEPKHPVVVASEVYETTGAVEPAVVEISNDSRAGIELTTPQDVEDFVIAVIRASAVAFPDGPVPLLDRYCDGGDDCGECGAQAALDVTR